MIKKFVLYFVSAVVGVAAAFTVSGILSVNVMTGSGMDGSIEAGRPVLINKLAYGTDGRERPDVGDIIAFKCDVYSEEGEGSILVRRVAGSFGDTVEIKDNIFYLNGKPYEKYMSEAAIMDPMEKIVLGDGQLFVLNDNRKYTMDSRNEAVGIVDMEDCIGRICFK